MKWRKKMDDKREYYKSAMVMIRLCNTPITCSKMRASMDDPIGAFVAGPGRDVAKLILSFKLGVKVGKGDLREASKTKLLEAGLELKVLRIDNNEHSMDYWSVIEDDEGEVSRGGLGRQLGGCV